MTKPSQPARIIQQQILSDEWSLLKKYTFDYQRSDGNHQQLIREVYDKGDGATLLLYNRQNQSVVLTRQFRFPLFIQGENGFLLEAAAGMLDGMDATGRIRLEAEEETGYRIDTVHKIMEAWMSPGAVTEKVHFFIAEYFPESKVSAGGGLIDEGEDITVVEMPFKQALAAIQSGEISDAKTIILLQHAALHGILSV